MKVIDKKTQARLDFLMDRNNEGTITIGERKELASLGHKVVLLSLENAEMLSRRIAVQRRKSSP